MGIVGWSGGGARAKQCQAARAAGKRRASLLTGWPCCGGKHAAKWRGRAEPAGQGERSPDGRRRPPGGTRRCAGRRGASWGSPQGRPECPRRRDPLDHHKPAALSEVLVGLHRCTEQDSASCRAGNSDPTQRAFQGAARVCSHACLDSQQAAQLHPEHAAVSGQDSAGWSLDPCHGSHAMGLRPNPSIERTTSGALRAPTVAAHVER